MLEGKARYHISFDMDDTLCSFVGQVAELSRTLLGKQVKLPGYGKYGSWFVDAFDDNERKELLSHVYTPEFYLGLPSAFSRHGTTNIHNLSQAAWTNFRSVSVVTARKGPLGVDLGTEVTREWLKRAGFHRYDEVTIHVHGHDVPKSTFLVPRSVMVDDSVNVATDVMSTKHKMILVQNVWNMDFPRSKNLMAVSSERMLEALILSADDQPILNRLL